MQCTLLNTEVSKEEQESTNNKVVVVVEERAQLVQVSQVAWFFAGALSIVIAITFDSEAPKHLVQEQKVNNMME
jgi:hypothetical protein